MLLSMGLYPRNRYSADASDQYRICVCGALDASWSDRLGGMTISTIRLADGTPGLTLTGYLADQSALVGVLNTLYDLGLSLVSVERVPAVAEASFQAAG